MTPTLSRRQRRRQYCSPRWERFQATPTSQRLLSLRARQEGYAVLQVPPALREAFLDVAWVFLLYAQRLQAPKRTLSAEQLARFVVWSEATRALVDVLRTKEEP